MVQPFALTRFDPNLDDETRAIGGSVREMLKRHSSPATVRAAEPLGFDASLWERFVSLGMLEMAVGDGPDGERGQLADLAVVVEEVGHFLAPIPAISHLVTTRAIAQAVGSGDLLSQALSGERPIALAFYGTTRQLVPDGAVAGGILALDGDALTLFTPARPLTQTANLGCTPLAWWSPDLNDGSTREVIAQGSAARILYADAVSEWRILMASALVGLTHAALNIGVEFAKTRSTRGAPIGSLQGIAFPLADTAIGIESARQLVRRVAWAADNDPERYRVLRDMPLPYAGDVATAGVATAVHVQGGLGFTVEADISLYFKRAKGWALLSGGPASSYLQVADAIATSLGVTA